MKYTIRKRRRFKKDERLAYRRGLDMQKLEHVVEKLSRGIPLGAAEKDHQLTGNFVEFRECHIEPDWLLIYHIDNEILVLDLIRTGSHSDVFKK